MESTLEIQKRFHDVLENLDKSISPPGLNGSSNDNDTHPFFKRDEALYLITFCEFLVKNSENPECHKYASKFLNQCNDLKPNGPVNWHLELKESFSKALEATVEGAQKNWKLFILFRNLEDEMSHFAGSNA